MKILFQYDHPLPVKTYGGTERILFWHMKELVRQGHQVVLIGHKDSQVQQYDIELICYDEKMNIPWYDLIPNDIDIIHLPYPFDPNLLKKPFVCTIHGNGRKGEKLPLNSIFVSKKHAEIHQSQTFIYNCLDLEEYPFQEKMKSWNNFLFLGKASWKVKNLKHCLHACKKSQKHLHIVGGRSLWPSQYIHSYGMLGGLEKQKVIENCDALLFPVRWPEPFGMAVIEAMSFGLPVIASRYGALPELVNSDVGILCSNYQEFLNAIEKKENDFDSKTIRNYVEENFSIEKYTKEYTELYLKVLEGENLNEFHPEFQEKYEAQELLPFL